MQAWPFEGVALNAGIARKIFELRSKVGLRQQESAVGGTSGSTSAGRPVSEHRGFQAGALLSRSATVRGNFAPSQRRPAKRGDEETWTISGRFVHCSRQRPEAL